MAFLDVRTLVQINDTTDGRWLIDWDNVQKPVLFNERDGCYYNDSLIDDSQRMHFYRDIGRGRKERVTISTAKYSTNNALISDGSIEIRRNSTTSYYDYWNLVRVEPFNCAVVDPSLVKVYESERLKKPNLTYPEEEAFFDAGTKRQSPKLCGPVVIENDEETMRSIYQEFY